LTCRHFGACGGCSLPGMPYADQLRRKQALVSKRLGLPAAAVVPSPREAGFRSKAAFVFGPSRDGRGIVMGHFASGSKRIVPIEECPVHSPRGNRIAFALRDELAKRRVRPDLLRHVIVRTSADDREAVVMLVVTRNDRSLRAPVKAFLDSAERPDGFFVNVHDRPGPYMVGRETVRISGRSHIRENALTASYLVSPTAFFQTNVAAAGELIRLVMSRAGAAGGGSPVRGRRVLDLYSGSGLFSIPLALAGAAVVAIEENAEAVDDAAANLRLNRVPGGRVRLVLGRAEEALARAIGEPFDLAVLDPPRQGCAPAVIEAVFDRMSPPRAIYVSCNPEALAGELPRIRAAGYDVEAVEPVDMFPHTGHLEVVVTLRRR
jgi:23S rRNA (uracil1939-C5)-methyltransferase